eukprot:gene26105-11819_t
MASGLSRLREEKENFIIESQSLAYKTTVVGGGNDDSKDSVWDEEGNRKTTLTKKEAAMRAVSEVLTKLLASSIKSHATPLTDAELDQFLEQALSAGGHSVAALAKLKEAGLNDAKEYLRVVLKSLYGPTSTASQSGTPSKTSSADASESNPHASHQPVGEHSATGGSDSATGEAVAVQGVPRDGDANAWVVVAGGGPTPRVQQQGVRPGAQGGPAPPLLSTASQLDPISLGGTGTTHHLVPSGGGAGGGGNTSASMQMGQPPSGANMLGAISQSSLAAAAAQVPNYLGLLDGRPEQFAAIISAAASAATTAAAAALQQNYYQNNSHNQNNSYNQNNSHNHNNSYDPWFQQGQMSRSAGSLLPMYSQYQGGPRPGPGPDPYPPSPWAGEAYEPEPRPQRLDARLAAFRMQQHHLPSRATASLAPPAGPESGGAVRVVPLRAPLVRTPGPAPVSRHPLQRDLPPHTSFHELAQAPDNAQVAALAASSLLTDAAVAARQGHASAQLASQPGGPGARGGPGRQAGGDDPVRRAAAGVRPAHPVFTASPAPSPARISHMRSPAVRGPSSPRRTSSRPPFRSSSAGGAALEAPPLDGTKPSQSSGGAEHSTPGKRNKSVFDAYGIVPPAVQQHTLGNTSLTHLPPHAREDNITLDQMPASARPGPAKFSSILSTSPSPSASPTHSAYSSPTRVHVHFASPPVHGAAAAATAAASRAARNSARQPQPLPPTLQASMANTLQAIHNPPSKPSSLGPLLEQYDLEREEAVRGVPESHFWDNEDALYDMDSFAEAVRKEVYFRATTAAGAVNVDGRKEVLFRATTAAGGVNPSITVENVVNRLHLSRAPKLGGGAGGRLERTAEPRRVLAEARDGSGGRKVAAPTQYAAPRAQQRKRSLSPTSPPQATMQPKQKESKIVIAFGRRIDRPPPAAPPARGGAGGQAISPRHATATISRLGRTADPADQLDGGDRLQGRDQILQKLALSPSVSNWSPVRVGGDFSMRGSAETSTTVNAVLSALEGLGLFDLDYEQTPSRGLQQQQPRPPGIPPLEHDAWFDGDVDKKGTVQNDGDQDVRPQWQPPPTGSDQTPAAADMSVPEAGTNTSEHAHLAGNRDEARANVKNPAQATSSASAPHFGLATASGSLGTGSRPRFEIVRDIMPPQRDEEAKSPSGTGGGTCEAERAQHETHSFSALGGQGGAAPPSHLPLPSPRGLPNPLKEQQRKVQYLRAATGLFSGGTHPLDEAPNCTWLVPSKTGGSSTSIEQMGEEIISALVDELAGKMLLKQLSSNDFSRVVLAEVASTQLPPLLDPAVSERLFQEELQEVVRDVLEQQERQRRAAYGLSAITAWSSNVNAGLDGKSEESVPHADSLVAADSLGGWGDNAEAPINEAIKLATGTSRFALDTEADPALGAEAQAPTAHGAEAQAPTDHRAAGQEMPATGVKAQATLALHGEGQELSQEPGQQQGLQQQQLQGQEQGRHLEQQPDLQQDSQEVEQWRTTQNHFLQQMLALQADVAKQQNMLQAEVAKQQNMLQEGQQAQQKMWLETQEQIRGQLEKQGGQKQLGSTSQPTASTPPPVPPYQSVLATMQVPVPVPIPVPFPALYASAHPGPPQFGYLQQPLAHGTRPPRSPITAMVPSATNLADDKLPMGRFVLPGLDLILADSSDFGSSLESVSAGAFLTKSRLDAAASTAEQYRKRTAEQGPPPVQPGTPEQALAVGGAEGGPSPQSMGPLNPPVPSATPQTLQKRASMHSRKPHKHAGLGPPSGSTPDDPVRTALSLAADSLDSLPDNLADDVSSNGGYTESFTGSSEARSEVPVSRVGTQKPASKSAWGTAGGNASPWKAPTTTATTSAYTTTNADTSAYANTNASTSAYTTTNAITGGAPMTPSRKKLLANLNQLAKDEEERSQKSGNSLNNKSKDIQVLVML